MLIALLIYIHFKKGEMFMLKLYGAPSCPKCMMAKQLLQKKGVDYEYVDTFADKNATDKVLEAGVRALPAMEINGVIKEFNISEV